MRLYQTGALLTGAHSELVPRAGVLVAAHAHGRQGIAQAMAARVDTVEHCSFAGPDRQYGSDFDPAVVDEIAAAGIYVCPTMNVHARTLRARFGDAPEKVIMGLYSGSAQIIAGTDAGIDNCPHDAYVSGLEGLAMVGLPAVEILDAATLRAARALGLPNEPPSGGPPPSETPSSGPPPGAEPAVAGPAAAASELAAPAGPSPR